MATGRPSKYDKVNLAHVSKLCELGATDFDLADFYEVNRDTIAEWKNKHKEFSDTIKNAKEKVDQIVERRLFERATGYKHPSVKIFQPKKDGGEPLIVDYIEHYPPDTVAAIFWLKNRQPDRWREKLSETDKPVEVIITRKNKSSGVQNEKDE